MHAEIDIGYGAPDTIKKMSDDEYRALVEAMPALDLPLPRPPAEEFGKAWSFYSHLHHIIDLETTGQLLTRFGLEFSVKRFKSTYRVEDPVTHHHLHVAIPNLALLLIDEVTWTEDTCTEELQRMLDDGWRILAVCPPSAQRRPDYVLGRTRQP